MSYANNRIKIEGVEIWWPNFSGAPTRFNPNGGTRLFNVLLPEDDTFVEYLRKNVGFNIYTREPKEDGEVFQNLLEVKVRLDTARPAIVYAIRGHNSDNPRKILLTEASIGMLDNLPILYADLILNPYPWNVSGNSGFKPYLVKGFFVIDEDDLDEKYADMEEVFCPLTNNED